MKKIAFLLFIGFISLSINAQDKVDANAPVFEFVTDIIDYGTVNLNDDGTRVFKFKNVGKAPIIIERIQSSCGCTVPKKPEEPILPGKTGEIEVKYNTHTPGGFSKSITVFSNASEPTKVLRIKGIVVKPESELAKPKASVAN